MSTHERGKFGSDYPLAGAKRRSSRRRLGGRRKLCRAQFESLEERTLLSSLSINSLPIVLSTPGPTSVSGSVNPGDELAAYRIDGTAGERLQFQNVSTSSSDGTWALFAENDQEVAGAELGYNFTANLTATGSYYLELNGATTGEIDYSFQIADVSDAPVATSGFGSEQSGTLAGGASTTFTFTASAGLPIYFNAIDRSYTLQATFTDPSGNTIFSNNASYNEGPYVLTSSGTYTLTLSNPSGSTNPYDFNMLSLPDAATSLALGATQTVGGTLTPGTTSLVYSFLGAAGERIFLNNEQNPGDPVYYRLIGPDNGQVFDIGSYSNSGPVSLTESGTYYLLVDGESSSPINYQFRLTDTAYSPLALGTTVSGTLDVPSASDVYTFSGTASERIYFQAASESDGYYGASWALYGPNNQQVSSSYWWNDFSATLPIDGTYTLVVSNYAYYSSSSTYSFATYVNVDPTSALALGQEVTGALANPGDTATYTFKADVGQNLYFDGLNSNGNGLSAELTNPNGTVIFDSGMASDAGPYTLKYGGLYSLVISGSGASTGSYDFNLSDTSSAPTIAINTPVNDTLATGASTNFYQFSGTAGESLYFQAQNNSGSYYYLSWALYGSGSEQLASAYYFTDFTATLPYTGTYLLKVSGDNYATSAISYGFEAFEPVNSTGALTLGQEVIGTMANPGDTTTYSFKADVGQNLYFNGLNSNGNGLSAELTNPNGTVIFDSGMASDAGPYTLKYGGLYSLVISGSGASTGSYDFNLSDTSSAPSIAINTPVNDTLATGASTNFYQFSGTAGESVYFQVQNNSAVYYDLSWALYGSGSEQLASAYYFTDFTATLPYTGTYLLKVSGSNYATSAISYGFEAFETVNSTGALTLGQEVIGTVANPGDTTTYTFKADVGQNLYFDGLNSNGNGLSAELTNPNGTVIFDSGMASDAGPYTLKYGGLYSLVVSGSGASTGSYDFNLSDTSSAPTIATNTPVNDTLATGASTNFYQFSGTAGESLYFQAQNNSGSYYYLSWALYGSGSEQLASAYYFTDFTATLPYTGTYLLKVSGSNYATSAISYGFEAFQTVNSTGRSHAGPGSDRHGGEPRRFRDLHVHGHRRSKPFLRRPECRFRR